MSTPLVVYDDAAARAFSPFSLTRPLATIRAGAELIGARWIRMLGATSAQFAASPHLATFSEPGAPTCARGTLRAGTVLANSRCVAALNAAADPSADVWHVDGVVAAIRLARPLDADRLGDGSLDLASLAPPGGRAATIAGRWLRAVWDLIAQLPDQLSEDTVALTAGARSSGNAAVERMGKHPIAIAASAQIDPFVLLDASAGPIVIEAGARVEAFTRINGPCVIGEGTHLLSGRVMGSVIGDNCRVHGDVSTSIFVGHVNKAHEGFVGHTVVGRWANLGAGTTTSNLKNSYGPVKLWTPAGELDTGLTFLGSLIGDHAKLAIGTMLGTGTVVGAGANVFGTVRPPKRVPPFAWGDAPPYETFSLDKFLDVAIRVMARRTVDLDPGQRAMLSAAHALAERAAW